MSKVDQMLDLKALNAGGAGSLGAAKAFPSNPNNQFSGQPRELSVNIALLVAGTVKAKQEISGYWLACCIGGSSTGAAFQVQFDQQAEAGAITLRPGQVVYVPFQNFTLTSIGIAYGSAIFKVGTSADSFFVENAATAPGGSIELLNGIANGGSSQVEGDTTAANLNAPPLNSDETANLNAGAIQLVGCKGIRVFVDTGIFAGIILSGSIRFWYGRKDPNNANNIRWYPSDVAETLTCLGEVASNPYPASGGTAATSDLNIAVPFGYLWAQALISTSIPASDFSVFIQRI